LQQSKQQQQHLSIEDVMQQWLPTVTDVTAHSLHVHLPDVIAAAMQIASHVCSTMSALQKHVGTISNIQATCTVDNYRTTILSDSIVHTNSSSAKHNARKNIVNMVLQVDSTAVQSLGTLCAVEHSSKDSNKLTSSSTSVIVDNLHAGVVYSILPLAILRECITVLNTVFQAIIEYQHSIGQQQVSLQIKQASDALLTYSRVIGNGNVNTIALIQCCCTEIKTLSTCKLY
jgi:hypothetical protein